MVVPFGILEIPPELGAEDVCPVEQRSAVAWVDDQCSLMLAGIHVRPSDLGFGLASLLDFDGLVFEGRVQDAGLAVLKGWVATGDEGEFGGGLFFVPYDHGDPIEISRGNFQYVTERTDGLIAVAASVTC
jgi:hypothetical protein